MNDLSIPNAGQVMADAPRPAISLHDGPGSLESLLPEAIANGLSNARAARPDLFDKGEAELLRYLKLNDSYRPNAADNRLRLKFWTEVDRARLAGDRKIHADSIYAGACYREVFYAHYVKNPLKMAWLACIPTGYWTKASEALEFGIEQLREVLEMDHVINGKIDSKILSLKVKIVDMMKSWVKGENLQRSVAVNVNTNNKEIAAMATHMTNEQMQARLKELERRARASQNIASGPKVEVLDAE